MRDRDRRIARELRDALAAETPVEDLVVFGSRAREDATAESDLDVFIQVPELTHRIRRRISEIAWQVGFRHDVVISTVVATAERIEHGPLSASPLLSHVREQGVRP